MFSRGKFAGIAKKQSETFNTIISITDWNIYFGNTKEKLENDLGELRKEIEV